MKDLYKPIELVVYECPICHHTYRKEDDCLSCIERHSEKPKAYTGKRKEMTPSDWEKLSQ